MRVFPPCSEGFRRLSIPIGICVAIAALLTVIVLNLDSKALLWSHAVIAAFLLTIVAGYLAVLLVRTLGWILEGFKRG